MRTGMGKIRIRDKHPGSATLLFIVVAILGLRHDDRTGSGSGAGLNLNRFRTGINPLLPCIPCVPCAESLYEGIVWETMQFCNVECLAQYQAGMSRYIHLGFPHN
jgi:hypothetical protein